ncbi:hypothetical protein DICA3_F05380 [Diutina catenulata]
MIDHLIVVPCHSIWTPKDKSSTGRDASEWALADFQTEGRDHEAFVGHVTTALNLAHDDDMSIAIISGGQTKKECGPVSESESYYRLAQRLLELGDPKEADFTDDKSSTLRATGATLARVTTEEYARDSLENVLFSVCRFYEVFSRYPKRITVVGFEFKRQRFLDLHLGQALGWDLSRVHYLGNSPTPPEDVRDEYFADLAVSEAKHAVEPFCNDWYGSRGVLAEKKRQRNPFGRVVPYAKTNPQLSEAFSRIERGERERVREVFPWKK